MHFTPVRNPAGQTAHGEQHREHARREAHRAVDEAGVEVDVRVELALDEVVVREGGLFELHCDVEQFVVAAELGEDGVRGFADQRSARIVVAVDAVPEAHELHAVFLVLDLADELGCGAAAGLDLVEHLEHCLVGAAVQRAPQCVDAGRDGGEQVGVRRADHAHGRRGAVLLVVGVQDQQHVECLGDLGITLVRLGGEAERHTHEVLDQVQRVVRVQERLSDGLLVRVRSDGRQLREKTDGGQFHLLRILGIERILVVRRQCVHCGRENRHRVSVARESVEEPLEVLVKQGVSTDAVREGLELGVGRQFAVDQQVADLDERRLTCQLLDGISAVTQDSLLTVDVGDCRTGGCSVHKTGVKGGVPRCGQQLSQLDAVIALCCPGNGHRVLTTGVSKRGLCVIVSGHEGSLSSSNQRVTTCDQLETSRTGEIVPKEGRSTAIFRVLTNPTYPPKLKHVPVWAFPLA